MGIRRRNQINDLSYKTTYGQKGGEGPNASKKAVNFTAVAPDGTKLTKRFFNGCALDVTHIGVAALLPPHNGYGWSIWAVAINEEAMPYYVKDNFYTNTAQIAFVPCQKV